MTDSITIIQRRGFSIQQRNKQPVGYGDEATTVSDTRRLYIIPKFDYPELIFPPMYSVTATDEFEISSYMGRQYYEGLTPGPERKCRSIDTECYREDFERVLEASVKNFEHLASPVQPLSNELETANNKPITSLDSGYCTVNDDSLGLQQFLHSGLDYPTIKDEIYHNAIPATPCSTWCTLGLLGSVAVPLAPLIYKFIFVILVLIVLFVIVLLLFYVCKR